MSDRTWVTELAGRIDDSAAESLWIYEHVAFPTVYESVYPYDAGGRMTSAELQEDRPDPLQWLGHVAALTERVKLGTGLMLLPLHNPLILAKRLASLDQLSGGRLIAGFGIGWLAEEYDALGIPFPERGRRADEYLQIITELWKPGPTTFHGAFHDLDGVYSNPKPVNPGSFPIVIGGHSKAAMRRAARFAQGVFFLKQTPADLERLMGLLRIECEAIGRPISEIEITTDAPRELEQCLVLQELGVSRLLLSLRGDDLDIFFRRLESYTTTILDHLDPVDA